ILGMIVTLFPLPRERVRAIGVYSFVASGGAAIGLLAGGAITEAISWNWIFFVNLPIGIAAFLTAIRILETEQGIGLSEGADVSGAVLVTGALMLGVYTLVEAADYGWASLHTVGPRRPFDSVAGGIRCSSGNGGQATPSITHLQVAQRLGRQRYCCADDRRILRDVFPRSAVHAARARLRSGRGRPRLPARRTPNRDARAGFLRAAEHAFRRRDGVGPRPIARCGRVGAAHTGTRRGRLRHRHFASDAAARRRRRPFLPGADDPGDVGRHAQRLGSRL